MDNLEDKVTEMCIHQVFRPERIGGDLQIPEGYGNCYECIPDYKNQECKGYYPIKVSYVVVRDYE